MNLIHNLRIGARLALAFGSTLVLMLAVAVIGFVGLQSADQHMNEIVHDNVVKIGLAQDMSESVHIVSRVVRTVVLMHDAETMATEQRKIDEARRRYDKAAEQLAAMRASDKGRALRATIDGLKDEARGINSKVIELARANKDAEALTMLMQEAAPKVAAWQAALDEYVALQKADTEAEYEAAHAADVRAEILLAALTAFAMCLTTLFGWLITRSITRPIRQAVTLAETVAAGDLSSSVEADGRDETAQLLGALKRMNTSLSGIVGNVRQASDSIATGSSQIATGNADLSQRTEQQASSLEETAASMEQLTTTVKHNADTARQADQLAGSASAAAVKGGAVVTQVVATMQDISASSRRIADIIGTIDSIAFQTNILALNAAVEAARAGEQGRGFAVVAGEVRSLAQRSAEAAKEIKSLIGASVEKVEAGSRLADEAGHSMGDIVQQVKRVTDLIAEISAASTEQTQGIGQVSQAVHQLDQVTQQNAALVEESAAAAESLRHQATRLAEAVAVFKLSHDAAASPPALATSRASPLMRQAIAKAKASSAAGPALLPPATAAAGTAPAAAPALAAEGLTPNSISKSTTQDDGAAWESF